MTISLRCWIIIFIVGIITAALPTLGLADEAGFYDNYGFGSFQLRSQSPGPSLRFTMFDVLAGPINAGWGISAGAAWTNTWTEEKNYSLDYEMMDAHVTISYGIDKRFEVGVFFENRFFFGGYFDNTIEGFHDLFGIGQNGRDKEKHNLSRVIIRDDQGNILTEFDADNLENNGVGFALKYFIYPGTKIWPAIYVSGQFRYALQKPDILTGKSEPFDTLVGIGLSKRFYEKWYTHFNIVYTRYGQTELEGMEFDDDSLSGMLTIAYNWTPNFSLLVQYIFHEGVINNLEPLSNYSHEIIPGFKWMTDHGGIFEIGVIENIIEMDNSPDIGLHFAYSYRF